MKKIWYYSFSERMLPNEDGEYEDADGNPSGLYDCSLEAEALELAEAKAPTEGCVFHSIEPEDRDDAIVSVSATPAFIEWLTKEGITWEEEDDQS